MADELAIAVHYPTIKQMSNGEIHILQHQWHRWTMQLTARVWAAGLILGAREQAIEIFERSRDLISPF